MPAPDRLLAAARALLVRVAESDAPETRVGYLTTQLEAMTAICRRLAGERLAYRDEVRLLVDVEPERTPEAVFDAAIAELDQVLPGRGPVAARMIDWRQRFAVAPETALALIDLIVPEIRRRTLTMVDLPAGEEIAFQLVSGQPWSGYNWYLGAGRSRVDLNTDLPLHANRLTDLLCHEAYPGHHTEHTLKERLYRDNRLGEFAIQLMNTPECVISEGIATLAEETIFTPDELARFRAERLYPAAGLAGDPERELAIKQTQRALRTVPSNAALLLHEDGRDADEVVAYLMRYGLQTEQEARHRLSFIANPRWRAYIFTYRPGYDLLGAWLAAAPPAERSTRFRTLLTEQVYPSLIGRWLAEERDRTPEAKDRGRANWHKT